MCMVNPEGSGSGSGTMGPSVHAADPKNSKTHAKGLYQSDMLSHMSENLLHSFLIIFLINFI